MSKELDARLAALIECCDETDRLIIDTRRFADLEDENARLRSCLSDDAENARMIMAENEKLRELCATVIDDWMSKVCPSFPFCEFGGEYQDCTDETCGNQIYRQMARELRIEVDDA